MYKIKKWKIETRQLKYINNDLPNGEFILEPELKREIGKIDDTHYFTQISVNISSTKENAFPIELVVVLRAVFEIENGEDADGINEFLKKQAVHILYPYVRSTVSGLTQTAMAPPIVLPLVNSYRMFPEEKPTE